MLYLKGDFRNLNVMFKSALTVLDLCKEILFTVEPRRLFELIMKIIKSYTFKSLSHVLQIIKLLEGKSSKCLSLMGYHIYFNLNYISLNYFLLFFAFFLKKYYCQFFFSFFEVGSIH